MSYLTMLKLVLSLLPLILDAVRAVEAALPAGKHGDAKLEMVRTVIEAGYTAADNPPAAFEEAWPVLERVVAGAVGMFNAVKVFTKS